MRTLSASGEPLVEVDLKEIVWPWLDEFAFHVDVDAAGGGGAVFLFVVVDAEFVGSELAISRSGAFFGFADAAEQSQDQVLTVGFDDERVEFVTNRLNKKIGHRSLKSRVNVQFWLLNEERRRILLLSCPNHYGQ